MSMRSDQNARHLERQADDTRRRLSATLDELVGNLTPGRMLDEVIAYSRGGGASFLKGVGNAASVNPLPTLLIGVGAAMFLSGKGRVDSLPWSFSAFFGGAKSRAHAEGRSASVPAPEDPPHAIQGAVRSASAGVRGAVTSAVGTASQAAEAIGEEVANATSALMETVAGMGEGVSEFAGTAAHAAAEEAARMRDQVFRLSHDMRDRGAKLAEEQPLLVAAAGIALGALAAALLPRTKVEDELMGETSDTVKGAAAEALAEQIETVTAEAGEVADEIKASVAEHGLTPKVAADAVRDAGDRISQALGGAQGDAEAHLEGARS